MPSEFLDTELGSYFLNWSGAAAAPTVTAVAAAASGGVGDGGVGDGGVGGGG